MRNNLENLVFQYGDYLEIPLSDGQTVLGQIVYAIPPPIRVPIIAFYKPKNRAAAEALVGYSPEARVNRSDFILIFCSAVVPTMILNKSWRVIGCAPEKIETNLLTRVMRYAKKKFAGLSVIDAQLALDCLDIHLLTARGLSLPNKVRESCQRILISDL